MGMSGSLTPSRGPDKDGARRPCMLPDAFGFAANDDAALPIRLGTEFGYGMAMFAGGFTGTRNVGFAYAGDRNRLDEGIGIAVRKEDDTLRLRLNRALGSIFADGTYRKIDAKSLPFSIY